MKKRIDQVLLIIVAGVFLFAGISKLVDPVDFSRSIEHYQIIGHPFSLVLALWIPWLECLASAGLLLRKWRLSASLILLGLLAVFELILTSAYIRGLDIDCGCFGKGIGQSVTFAFFRNLGLMAMLIISLQIKWKRHESPSGL